MVGRDWILGAMVKSREHFDTSDGETLKRKKISSERGGGGKSKKKKMTEKQENVKKGGGKLGRDVKSYKPEAKGGQATLEDNHWGGGEQYRQEQLGRGGTAQRSESAQLTGTYWGSTKKK